MKTIDNTKTESNDIAAAAADTIDHALNSAHKAIEKASDAARPAIDHIAKGAHQAVDKLSGAATKAAERLENNGDKFKGMLTRLGENCTEHVRDKPIRSLAYAIAAGFLFSSLIKKR